MSLLKWLVMGSGKQTTNETWNNGSEKYFGLENALYFCKPFRECVLNFPNGQMGSFAPQSMSPTYSSHNSTSNTNVNGESSASNYNNNNGNSNGSNINSEIEDTLFGALKDLFTKINNQKKRTGVLNHSNFITKLRKENDSNKTWVHKLFEGTLTNETKCLTCETVTSRDESFLDLSIDIEQNTSVTNCLKQFSASEILCHKNKFLCDVCCSLQEAEKRMKIKKLPNVLALHLKRFKFQEKLQKNIKLSYRVVFPFELRLFNTCNETEDAERLYELYAICVHVGSNNGDTSTMILDFVEGNNGNGNDIIINSPNTETPSPLTNDDSFPGRWKITIKKDKDKDHNNNPDNKRKSHHDQDNNNPDNKRKSHHDQDNNNKDSKDNNSKDNDDDKPAPDSKKSWFSTRPTSKSNKDKEDRKSGLESLAEDHTSTTNDSSIVNNNGNQKLGDDRDYRS
ncbi:9042_t:CDS:10 [Entrophospora sp. SA101]|nr:9042_t:CDS:10 [Entrophospora sp. SA101]